MIKISRRAALGILATAPLARPALIRGQTISAPVKIGLLSDVVGPYRENGGPGSKLAAEMAVEDFGGSLLGRPLQVMQADDQNKPDVANNLAREWIDDQGVALLADGASSAAALAIQQVTREKKHIYVITTSIANDLVGRQCSPYSFQFGGNAYALTKGVADTLTRQGGDSWFIITVDYTSGYALQASMEDFVRAAGGRIFGAVRSPLGTPDYSSYLIQAQASKAKVIGFGLAGADLQNCVKQAHEFGIVQSGQRLATPIIVEPDVFAIGQDACEGLLLSASFSWNLSPKTRVWSERFIAKMNKPPTQYHASMYAAVAHWLKAADTLDADAVAVKMRELRVSDFYHDGISIQPNGSVPITMYLFEVKSSARAKERWDIYNLLGTLPSPQAFPTADAFGCPLAKA
jgi:branched-chain amino acid transport system substrate-binding protein